MQDLKDILNVGIPNYQAIDMDIFGTTLSCAKNTPTSIEVEREIRKKATDETKEVFEKETFNTGSSAVDRLAYVTSPEDSSSTIAVDDEQKLINLFGGITQGLDRLTEEPLSVIEDSLDKYEGDVDYIRTHQFTTEFHNRLKARYNSLYYGRNYPDLRSYLIRELNFYKEILSNLDKLPSVETESLIRDYLDTLEVEKVGLKIAYRYYDLFIEAHKKGEKYKAQTYLFYIASYLSNKQNRGTIINSTCSYDDLKSRYKIIMSKNIYKDLDVARELFLGNTKEVNEPTIDSYITTPKIIIPESFIRPGYRPTASPTKESEKRAVTPVTEEEMERIRKSLEARRFEYMKHNPLLEIEGEGFFNKYIAFVYENGNIPADRFLKIYRESELLQDAVYNFNIDNFDSLIQKNKQQLIGVVPRVFHKTNWAKNIAAIAEAPADDKRKEEVREFVKRKTK